MHRLAVVPVSALSLLVALAGAGCDRGEPDPASKSQMTAGKTKTAKTDAKAKFDTPPDAKKTDKGAAEDKAATKAKPDRPLTDEDRKAAASDKQDAAAEFANSREDKVVEVTAQPGTPEWFVQGLEAFRAGNIDPIVANFAANIEWDAVGSPLEPPSLGKQAVMSRWEDLLTAMPDMKLHAQRIFTHGDLVVLQVVLTGTHKGDFRGIAPTGAPLGTEVLAWVWHDKDHKAAKVRVVYDEAALLAQMGKLPGGEPPPIPEIPSGAPEIVMGDDDKAAIKLVKQLHSAGKNGWKLCSEKLCTAGMASHDASSGKTSSTPAEHQAESEAIFAAFPDLKLKDSDAVSFGAGWVVTFGQLKGTHKGKFGAIEPTKKKVDVFFSEVSRMQDGKLAESWGYANHLQLLAQLGVFTAPPAGAPKPASDAAKKPAPAAAPPTPAAAPGGAKKPAPTEGK